MDTSTVINVGSAPLLLLFLGVIGRLIKESPLPNWLIPWVLPVIGALVYPFLAEDRTQWVVNGIHGLIFGSGTVGMHQAGRVARKELEERKVEQLTKRGETEE